MNERGPDSRHRPVSFLLIIGVIILATAAGWGVMGATGVLAALGPGLTAVLIGSEIVVLAVVGLILARKRPARRR